MIPQIESPGVIVMYHYVRPDRSVIPAGIRPLLVSEFHRQLDWLGERYEIVNPADFLKRTGPQAGTARLGHGALSKPPCLLTFDDGTKDHAEIVTPILFDRGLTGLFFVLTWPAELKKMPLTHAVHWLLSGDDERVWEDFERDARDRLGGISALGDPAEARRIYHYETTVRGRIKYAANMALPAEATERIVRSAVQTAGRTMEDLAGEWFVSPEDIRRMSGAGMAIAMHGSSHRSLQTLGSAGIREEIHHSSAYLHSLTGLRPKWFACPFGGTGASAEAIAAMHGAMRDVGVVGSVTTEKKYVFASTDPLLLPRLDAIDLPPRRAEPLAA